MAKRAKKAKKKAGKARKVAKKAAAKKKVLAVPAGYHTVTPYLVCRNASAAIEFYKQAFGARVTVRMDGPDGSVGHAELKIGDSLIMLGDENPQMGQSSPQTLGGTASGCFIYTPNVDKAFAKAIAAGATAEQPPTDMFWGDRYGKLADPFGHKWSIGTHIEDVPAKEMAKRAAEFMKQQG